MHDILLLGKALVIYCDPEVHGKQTFDRGARAMTEAKELLYKRRLTKGTALEEKSNLP